MQWLLNLMFKGLSHFFSLIGKINAPDWLSDLILDIAKYAVIANYYFPLDTLVTVALSVFAVTVVLMIISALLQIF